MPNHGLLLDKIEPQDYFGGGKIELGGEVLRPDGQWDDYLPSDELQNKGFEPSACVSFGTLNCVEVLERFIYGDVENYSDRFLAYASGTTLQGNSPQKVAEKLRKAGAVKESEWPYPENATWTTYYQTPPQNMYTRALEFMAKYDFGHQYESADPLSMMKALTYSPLGVAVFAWPQPDSEGILHRPLGAQSNHWCMVYGYVPNQYWKVMDTYDNTKKKLAWNFGFEQVKRYTLHKQVVNNTAWGRFVALLKMLFPI